MKKIISALIVALWAVGGAFALNAADSVMSVETELYKFLKSSKDIKKVTPIKRGEFAEKYVVEIAQPLDYKTDKGSFTQRFVVAHIDKDSVNVIVTEGYVGDYSLNPRYREEISKHLNGNMIFVEHRYFSGSTPEPVEWEYFNGYNAANDLHRINQLMKQFYGDKRWVATGISKGGQNSIIYRTYFPNDVQVTVPYVAPICFGAEDGRHEPFLRQVGDKAVRDRIEEFQIAVLKNRAAIEPMLQAYSDEKKLKYFVPISEILDYCVLEYPFSFWQWGSPADEIPAPNANNKVLFDYLVKMVGPDYFTETSTTPFFVQAAKELGYYGYDVKPFKGLLSIKSSKGYLDKLFFADSLRGIKFDQTLAKDIDREMINNDHKMIYIYGEYDPWSAAMAKPSYFKGKQNMVLLVEAEGSHKARISTLSMSQRHKAWDLLRKWLSRD